MGENGVTVDHSWTDADDEPLGGWAEIDFDEYSRIIYDAGGLDALIVFSSLTDPEGTYGPRQIYTAWGLADEPAPLVDIRDYGCYDEHGYWQAERTIRRRFVVTGPFSPEGEDT